MKRFGVFLGRALSALLIIAIGVGIAWTMHDTASRLPLRQYFATSYVNAVWDWSNPLQKNQRALDDLSDFLYLHQLNAIYVNVDGYIVEGADTDQLDKTMYGYIKTLQKRGVAVFAAGGDVSWSNRENWGKPKALLAAVDRYNTTHPDAQFAGVEFDIESYNQEGFASGSLTAKTLVLTDYLDMVDMLAGEVEVMNKAGKKLELGFAIPYWFDNQNGNIPSVSWNGKTGPTLYHLLDRLNSIEKSNVVVMAYRNAARGNDGVIAHARTEVEYAQAKAPNVGIIIGQEVGDVEPAKITYYGETTTELSSQVKAIEEEFKNAKTLRGIAINDLAALQEMQE